MGCNVGVDCGVAVGMAAMLCAILASTVAWMFCSFGPHDATNSTIPPTMMMLIRRVTEVDNVAPPLVQTAALADGITVFGRRPAILGLSVKACGSYTASVASIFDDVPTSCVSIYSSALSLSRFKPTSPSMVRISQCYPLP